MNAIYWLARRAYLRWRWRCRDGITFGDFLAGLEGAPAWLHRGTAPWWDDWTPKGRALRRVLREYPR